MLEIFLVISFLIVLAAILVLFLQPRWLFSTITSIAPGVIYFSETNKPVIALTIDDGPDATTTSKILEILQRNAAQATFFVVSSRVKGNEPLIAKIVAKKNELGNHLTEDKPSIKLLPQEFEANLLEAHTVISKFTNPHWMRPASGWYNNTMLETARKYGYRVALGSLFPFDTHIHSSWFAAQHILLNVRPGSIIILHDCGSRGRRTAETLEMILPKLCSKGYSVVTLTELLQNEDLN